jgi:HK97 family phage major capsid protein
MPVIEVNGQPQWYDSSVELAAREAELAGYARRTSDQHAEYAAIGEYRQRTARLVAAASRAGEAGHGESIDNSRAGFGQPATAIGGERTALIGTGPRAAQSRTAAMRTIEARFSDGSLPDYAAERARLLLTEGGPGPQGLAAEYISAAGDPDYESAFIKICGDPTRGHMLWSETERAAYTRVQHVRTAMGTGTGVGGDMIPLTLDPTLMITNAGSNNNLRQISRIVRTVSNTWQGVSTAGATAEWKAEQAQAADGSPATAPKPIPVYLADVDVIFSYEIGMDALNFQSELRRVIEDAIVQLTMTAYTTGGGSTLPKGFVPNATAPTRTAGAFTVADVYLLQNSLPPRFSANAQWCGNIAVLNQIAQFQIGTTQYAFPEIRQSPPRLLTKPVNEISNMSADMSTAASRFLAYGDFQQFVIVDRVGSTLEILPGYGANQRPTGQRHAFMYFRTGSDLVIPTAIQVIAKT